jgi:hypothetical protein
MRAVVIMPRSRTSTMFSSAKVSFTAVTAAVNAVGSALFPSNTRTATGQPAGSVSTAYSICGRFFFPSREYPRLASGQCVPVIHEDDRSYSAIRDGFTAGPRYLAAKFFSITSCRVNR